MTTFVLEMRSTANWDDVRYREYTTSARKADLFKAVPKIAFTDSGHHIIPVVKEHRGKRLPINRMLADHVIDAITAMGRQPRPPQPSAKAQLRRAAAILNKLIAAYDQQRDPIPDSDLDNEQPISLTVRLELGDIRMAHHLVRS